MKTNKKMCIDLMMYVYQYKQSRYGLKAACSPQRVENFNIKKERQNRANVIPAPPPLSLPLCPERGRGIGGDWGREGCPKGP